ncbi:MAG: alpha/beta fold hydrolase, partial [bacterium]|nr:alpha/beta fold hydrolase [bacterium]
MLVVRLMARIEEEFDRRWPLTVLFETPTLGQLAAVVRGEHRESSSSALVALEPRGSRPPFFCVHGINGTSQIFRDLARRLGYDQPFYALRAPGLEEAAEFTPSIEAMAGRYLESVRQVRPTGPYLLGGWSFGCAVAFEMAQQLTRAGGRVALLALFDGVPPGEAGYEPPESDAELLVEHLHMNEGRSIDVPGCEIEGLSPEKSLRWVVERARASGLLPPELDLERLKRLLAGYRARSAAYRAYRPEVYPGRISLFHAGASAGDAAARKQLHKEMARGWGRLAAEPIAVCDVEGSHVLMFKEPVVREVAERLHIAVDGVLAGET